MRRLCSLLLCLLAASALAHGGEDHGAAPRPVSSLMDETHALGATGDVFEVVLKHPQRGADGKTPLRVFVAETDTNAPVSGAEVELTLTGSTVQALKPKMGSPGVYLAEAELPVGAEFAASATITRGEAVDVLALGVVHLEPEESTGSHGGGPSRGWLLGAVAGGLAVLALGLWARARMTRRATP
jgi:cobalt-zinc-cadmium efflux system membrane fusion protein